MRVYTELEKSFNSKLKVHQKAFLMLLQHQKNITTHRGKRRYLEIDAKYGELSSIERKAHQKLEKIRKRLFESII